MTLPTLRRFAHFLSCRVERLESESLLAVLILEPQYILRPAELFNNSDCFPLFDQKGLQLNSGRAALVAGDCGIVSQLFGW